MKSTKRPWFARNKSSGQTSKAKGEVNATASTGRQATLSKFFTVQSVPAIDGSGSEASTGVDSKPQTSSSVGVAVPSANTLTRLQCFQSSSAAVASGAGSETPSSSSCKDIDGTEGPYPSASDLGRTTADNTAAGSSPTATVKSGKRDVSVSSSTAMATARTATSERVVPLRVSQSTQAVVCQDISSGSEGSEAESAGLNRHRPAVVIAAKKRSYTPAPTSSSPVASFSTPVAVTASSTGQSSSPGRHLLPYTPLEKQYLALRDANPGVLLMVECGYKFRFFGQDAEVAARILNIFCHPMHNFMNASIPVPRLPVHVRRLVMAGYKVGVVRQTESAAHKAAGDNRSAPFQRKLTDIYTRATLVGEEFDTPAPSQPFTSKAQRTGSHGNGASSSSSWTTRSSSLADSGDEDGGVGVGGDGVGVGSDAAWSSTADNYLMFIVDADPADLDSPPANTSTAATSSSHHMAVVAVQPATGDVVHSQFTDDSSRHHLLTHLAHVVPSEVITPTDLSAASRQAVSCFCADRLEQGDVVRQEEVPSGWNDYGSSYGCLCDFFKVHSAAVHALSDAESSDDEEEEEEVANLTAGKTGGLPSHHSVRTKDHDWRFVQTLSKPVIVCLGLALRHLKQFSLATVLADTDNYSQFTNTKQCMVLNEQSLRSLEIFRNTQDGTERGSLFSLMVNTSTAFGRRLFRKWLAKPLVNRSAIVARHDAVEELCSNAKCSGLRRCKALLSHSPDVERGLASILHKKCSTVDFFTTLQALALARREVLAVQDELLALFRSTLLSEVFNELPDLLDGVPACFDSISSKAAKCGDKTELFTDLSHFPELAQTKKRLASIDTDLLTHRREVRLKLGMPALEYKTVSGDDYLIEVSHKLQHKVPQDWDRINSTKQAARYRTPLIVEKLKERALLRETLSDQSQLAWLKYLREFAAKFGSQCRRAVQHLASLDCLISLAKLAAQPGYVRPTMLNDDDACELDLVSSWHPVVSALMSSNQSDSQFVANSARMHKLRNRVSIVTGPNMGGKSCFVRQVAVSVVMCQVGAFVPAQSARLSVLDGVYVRMGASDDMGSGRSTFMVELQETSDILQRAGPRSLVILDELGRGTSTHDGVAIAYATLEYLITDIECLVLFVTHYPLLSELCDHHGDAVRAFHMAFFQSPDDTESITFLYQLVAGHADKSYGLNVARLACLPAAILAVAREKSHAMEAAIGQRRSLPARFVAEWNHILGSL